MGDGRSMWLTAADKNRALERKHILAVILVAAKFPQCAIQRV